MRKNILITIVTIIISAFCFCEDNIEYNTGAKLDFSCDTLKFDTVFTGEKSSIHFIKITNNSGKNININSIHLENDDNQIHLNINGWQSNSAENIELLKGDSIFVFAQAELKNGTKNLAFTNSLIVNTGADNQKVIITAYGINVTKLNGLITTDTVLPANTAYISHNGFSVDKNAKLTIKEGVALYFNKNCGIDISGSLQIEGTLEKPVKLQGIRTEQEYSDIPAQWKGIIFHEDSKKSVINYATIRNTQTAISAKNNQTLTIANCILENNFYNGIALESTNTLIYNTLVHNCGNSCITIEGSGNYNILNCTLADYWNINYRKNAVFNCTNNIQNVNVLVVNSIIDGNHSNEIDFNPNDNITFSNCLIKSDLTSNEKLNSCKLNIDPEFANLDSVNFRLKPSSPAVDMANYGYIMLYDYLATDYYGNSRSSDENPDAGFAECIK